MTLAVGWHHLDDDDDAPPLAAAAFLDVAGATAGMRSPERLCRPYFKGRPSPGAAAALVATWAARGCRVQVANEPNLPAEGFGGGPDDYARWFDRVRELVPGARLYWAGMSPGVPGWEGWYAGAAAADGIAAHAYGTLDEMRRAVEPLLATGRPIWLAEVNFGASRQVDRDRWATVHLAPFLEWCATEPRIEAATYFARRWPRPDVELATPVDGAGTGIERLLREWRPATERRVGMRIGLCYRMGSDIPEQSGRAVVNLWKSGGLVDVCPKAADGDALEGQFDRSPIAINTLDDVANQTSYYRSQGLDYLPWVVPRGADPLGEALLHAEIAKRAGAVIVDFEWQYAGFFDRGAWSEALAYVMKLRVSAPDARIIWCPDPRQLAWGANESRSAYDFAAIRQFVDALAPQVYWTDFQSPWEGVLIQGVPLGMGMPVYPVLPANAAPDELEAAIRWLAARGIERVFLFQRASLRTGVLERLVGLATPDIAPVGQPAEPTYPNGRRIPSSDEYDLNCWGPLQRAADALMNGGDGAGDDEDAAAILELKRRSEERHGIRR